MKRCQVVVLAVCMLSAAAASAVPINITVTVTNLQPQQGAYLTPFFMAAHDGTYDVFDVGAPSSLGLERVAEDGITSFLMTDALNSGHVAAAQTTAGGPIAPGESRSLEFMVDSENSLTSALSFASMVIPSNDAFIGNAAPLALQLFDGSGNLIVRDGLTSFVVFGRDAYDAGAEMNDELFDNTAFLGQAMPDTGLTEGGVIRSHPGFQGSVGFGGPLGNILSAYPAGDFTLDGARLASISVVPEPATLTLLGAGLVIWLGRNRRS